MHSSHSFDVIPVAVQEAIDPRLIMAGGMELDDLAQQLGHALGARLTAYLLGTVHVEPEYVEQQESVCMPLSWWQHFKQDYFPFWWLRRWPIQYNRIPVVMNIYKREARICPHINLAFDRHQRQHLLWVINHHSEDGVCHHDAETSTTSP